MTTESNKRIIIVGGGPVGAINAIFLSRRGFHVDLYEQRTDIREEDSPSGRSINLALSVRGIQALRHAGLDDRITKIGVPMYSRYIHAINGANYTLPYGRKDQNLFSIDRLKLNCELLSAANECPNVTLHFEHKLIKSEPENASATFQRSDKTEVQENGSLLVGCDGAYSRIRTQMTKSRMDYSQTYIPHGYKELTILPDSNGDYAIPPNHLHIWPRGSYMMIALPNLDCSFTCTLFMPFDIFDALKTGEDVLNFFKATFIDSVPLIGEKELTSTFFNLPPLPLISVKCSPFHSKDSAVIMGDAAHAVVPFYGQGLNCGLEDALIFDGIMEELHCELSKVLPRYSAVRVKAAHAIVDLSTSNYEEMRSHVTSTWFVFRKKIDSVLHSIFPSTFIPKYSMVAFTRISYDEVIRRSKQQSKMVDCGLALLGASVVTGIVYVAWKNRNSDLAFPYNFVSRWISNMTEKWNLH